MYVLGMYVLHPSPCDSSWVCKGIIADGCGTSSVFWNTWILILHRGDITVFTYAECRLIGLIAFLPRIITSIPMDLLCIGFDRIPGRLANVESHERYIRIYIWKRKASKLCLFCAVAYARDPPLTRPLPSTIQCQGKWSGVSKTRSLEPIAVNESKLQGIQPALAVLA